MKIKIPMVTWLAFVLVTLIGCTPSGARETELTTTAAPATPSQSEHWQTYSADSGYDIQYPLETYSRHPTIETEHRIDLSKIIFPGPQTLEPDDSFYYQKPEAVTYQITINVVSNDMGWSLENDAERLLTENSIDPYNTGTLAGHAVQTIILGGEKAIRVDGIKEGPLEITTQIVVIHHGFIFDLLIEPQGMPFDQTYTTWPTNAANRELCDKILATFKFNN